MSQMSLSLDAKPELFEKILQRFQKGVKVKARVGSTVRSFLCDDLALSPEYVDGRIQTLFLNGRAVDNPDNAHLPEDSTLALSAAMPGLLGATLRKGGYYARLRSEISHHEKSESVKVHEGLVLLKLFNLLPAEIGPAILQRGIWLQGEDLNDFFRELPEDLVKKWGEARVDGQSVDPATLGQRTWKNDWVLVKISRA